MSDKKLRVGVIGLGFIGSLHARIHSELPNAHLVAVADVDGARAQAVGKEFGVDYYTNFEELLARSDIDAVSVCVPDRLHVAPAVAAAKAGKAILLEKPMAHTGEAAEKIKLAADQADVRLMIGHVLRFDPRYVQLHDAVVRGEIGEPIHLRAKRNGVRSVAERLRDRTSILYYMAVHDIDMMRWCARAEITRVFAQKVEKLGNDNEDALYAVVNFSNGAIGLLDYSWAWPNGLPSGYYAAFEIVGTKSGALMDVYDQGLHLIGEATVTQPDTHLWPEVNGRIVGDLRDELLHFAEVVLDGEAFRQPVADALQAVRVLDAVAESVRTNQPVDVVLPADSSRQEAV